MLEIPESYTLAQQLNQTISGKTIKNVYANTSPHGFAFYFGDPASYHDLLSGKVMGFAKPLAGQIEVTVEDTRLLFGDGVSIRYYAPLENLPPKHQLHIEFHDDSSIVCTVQMYGGMWAFLDGENNNPYYVAARVKPSPLTDQFDREYFLSLLKGAKSTISVKALLATEQRIPGLGNGVLQDILFNARLNPKRKLNSLGDQDVDKLFMSIKQTILEMSVNGGRDTEKDLFGCSGGYKTILSNKTYKHPCPVCNGEIVSQAYLGGNVYFCPTCQPV